ncbi:hypothetical protein HLB23_40470 [Nocardia uniformis]|uniref:Uncharacterized protein n=1 Tax=Nocardia uniformis TaxID=53432 RepID=A0A849CGL2_9NOCA|nr:hypothetical protein [Nocardia uniformis]NNH76055.1 hypothetical protein [Nocardia uniformis]
MSETAHDAPLPHSNLFVNAEGTLAEYLCCAEPLGMTTQRALQLRDLHDGHSLHCRILTTAELNLP